jgi:hypothetical protein
MKNLFASAASLLLGDPPEASVIHDVHLLLTELDYASGGAGREGRHRPPARIASQFSNFRLTAPEAPG